MVAILLPCIYCGRHPAAPGEHLIPAALGRFPLDGTSKAVLCKREGDVRGCNEELTGPLCDRLFRRGPMSLYRRSLPRAVGRSSRGRKRSAGLPYEPPPAPIPGTDVAALMEVDQGGVSGRYADQIVFELADGRLIPWRIPESISTAAELRAAVRAAGFFGTKGSRFIGDAGGRIERIVREAFPHWTVEMQPPIEAGQTIKFKFAKQVDAQDARAIAMLAFHFFLAFYQPRGSEPGFAAIRDVVRGIGDPLAIVAMQDPATAATPIHVVRDERPGQDKHLALFYVSPDRQLFVDLRLFSGSAHAPWWRVSLGRNAPESMPQLGVALCYFPEERSASDGRLLDGEIVGLRSDDATIVVPAPEARQS